jgi:YVTN family beta-propeller protein
MLSGEHTAKGTMKNKLFALWALTLLCAFNNFQLSTAHAQGTAFTYQGRLNDGASGANGTYDVSFALYDALTVGTQQEPILTNSATAVSNGLFAVTLDFGNQFTGANRWLEIGVRTNGNGTFSTLSPRQKITPTPYAIYANSASAAGLIGVLPAAQLPASVVTNGASGVSLNGAFSGDGSGLTGLPVAAPANRLQQVALLKWWGASSADNTVNVGAAPLGMCFDGANVWVANWGNGTLTKLSVNGANLGTYGVGVEAAAVCFDGTSIWVVSYLNNFAAKLNPGTGAGTAYTVGTHPYSICFDGANIWTANRDGTNVTKLNPNTGAVIGTYTVGLLPSAVCYDGASIWVANFGSGNAMKLNPTNGVVLGTYNVGIDPYGICFDGTSIWVANYGSANVMKLNPSTGTVLGTYNVGTNPFGICFDGASIWVANMGSANVTKLNASTGAVLATYNVGPSPSGICFDGFNIWVSNFGTTNVTKL